MHYITSKQMCISVCGVKLWSYLDNYLKGYSNIAHFKKMHRERIVTLYKVDKWEPFWVDSKWLCLSFSLFLILVVIWVVGADRPSISIVYILSFGHGLCTRKCSYINMSGANKWNEMGKTYEMKYFHIFIWFCNKREEVDTILRTF